MAPQIKRYYAKTDQGPYLNINEDGCYCGLEENLFMIFDGFGGAHIGDKAVELLKKQHISFFLKTTDRIDATMPFFHNPKHNLETNALINAIICSHKLLYKYNLDRPVEQRGGASGIFATQSGNILNIVSTGICLSMLLRGTHVYPVFSHENSLGLLSGNKERAGLHSIPYSTFGMYEKIEFSIREVKILEGDKFFFMTDGAAGDVSESIFDGLELESMDLKELIESLFHRSNELGNKDNQTCLILEY